MELEALLDQTHLFAPKMQPLAHICTEVDNMATQVWSNRGGVRSSMAVGPILRDLALLIWGRQIYVYVGRIRGEDNMMADDELILTHLPDRNFLCHFSFTFPHKNIWRIPPLLSKCRQCLNYMHTMRCHMDFQPLSTRRTLPPRTNGKNYAFGCASQPTSKVSGTQPLISRSSLSAFAPVFCKKEDPP